MSVRRYLLLVAFIVGLAAVPATSQEWCEVVADPSPPEASEEFLPKADTPIPIVDLLALVIPEAGPVATVRPGLEAGVAAMNQILQNSEVPGMVQLLDVISAPASFPYHPGDNPDLLFELFRNTDVQRLRDEYGADLVTLVVPADMLPHASGIAYLARSSSSGYSALSVTSLTPTFTGIVVPHELGHNLGLPHDKANAGNDGGPYAPRAYGHWGQLPDGIWFSDIMSYAFACPHGCTVQVPFFSNPEVTYQGVPMGLVGEREAALFLKSDAMRRVAGWRSKNTPPSPPPATGMITSSEFPDFRFWVRIGNSRMGTSVVDCLPETVCVAGAIPTRAEVFVRIVGPKSNGYLWPNIVKFNTTKTEVWIEQVTSGVVKYYSFPALTQDASELPGYVDKTGFLP